MIKVSNLFQTYNGKDYILKGIDLFVNKGEIFGLLGPNGAGKSTFISVITCAIPFQKGEVIVSGYNIKKYKREIKRIISISTQEFACDYLLSVEDNLIPFLYLYELDIKKGKKELYDLLEIFNLTEKRKVLACNISGGQLRRLQIVRALLKKPEILILDEPTLGLDPIGRMELGQILKNYIKEGKTVFLATNEMNEAEMLCDRVAFINDGKMLDAKPVNEFISEHVGELIYEINFPFNYQYNGLIEYLKNINEEICVLSYEPLVVSSNNDHAIQSSIIKYADEMKIIDYEIKKRRTNLNDVFIKLVKGR
jgi:ABC-2 type transport system ATP-binding protein